MSVNPEPRPSPPGPSEEEQDPSVAAHHPVRRKTSSARSSARTRGRVAVGLIEVVALIGIVGGAVIAGAILVDDTTVPGWIDGLAIGAGSVCLTLLLVFNGRRARKHLHRTPV